MCVDLLEQLLGIKQVCEHVADGGVPPSRG